MAVKRFDPDAALARARDVFWAKGYAGTSAQDLVDAMGINRGSLYGTFGSKRLLYERALDLYLERDG
jgi:TetR/AcrR family transcriptional repressor of nem operon